MVATLGKDYPSYATVKRLVAELKHGRESLEDDPHSGRPVSVAAPQIVTIVHDMVMGDRWVAERYISSAVGISQERVHTILMEDLDMRKLSSCWVPRHLTVEQKHTIQNMLVLFRTFFWDRSWQVPAEVCDYELNMGSSYFTPESKQQSKQRKQPDSTCQSRQRLFC